MLKTNVDDISCILQLKFPFRQNIYCLWSLKNKNLRSGCYESLVLISVCQLFHIHQLSRLVSTAIPWSILPILGLSALLINTYMTEKTDLFLSISVQTEEHNCRNLSLKKIGLKAEAFLGLLKGISMFTMQKQLQKTCLITSGVLNQFLLDWAKEGDKKIFGPFQICVTNYTVIYLAQQVIDLNLPLCMVCALGLLLTPPGVAQLDAESPAPAPLTWQGHHSSHWSCGGQPEPG